MIANYSCSTLASISMCYVKLFLFDNFVKVHLAFQYPNVFFTKQMSAL